MCVAAVIAEPTADQLTASGVAEFSAAYEKWDASRFGKAAEFFRQAETSRPNSSKEAAWRGAALFHQMLQLQSKNDAHGAKVAMSAAIAALEIAVKRQADHPEANALLATLYGMTIQQAPLQALRLGPALLRHRNTAQKHGTSNPRVHYLIGTGQFHTAKTDSERQQALKTLLAAETFFQAEAKMKPSKTEHRWGYPACLTFIARSYESLNRLTEAQTYYKKALAAHPADHLAKQGLERLKGK